MANKETSKMAKNIDGKLNALRRIFCQECMDARNGKLKDTDHYVDKMMEVAFGKNWKEQLKKETKKNG